MDLVAVSEATAALVAAGAAQGVGEQAATGAVSGMLRRIREVFGGDRRALDSLDETASTGAETAVRELASALRWYAERDRAFAAELERWAGGGRTEVNQNVRAGRDAFVAGRDQQVTSTYPSVDD